MPPRPLLPADDLYARLELPVDASFEAVEIAWRALLKRHHPDIAGPAAVEVAKRINVAHDWLSDPALRDRYDRERHPRRDAAGRAAASGRSAPPAGRGGIRSAPDRPRAAPRPRPPLDPAQALAHHIDRVRRLSEDELDRLSLAETAPIAFIASISRFLPVDRQDALRAIEPQVQAALPRRGRWDPPTRDAAVGFAQEIVLGPFLDEHLSGDFRDRVRERLTRGWQAAVDQPRYGPNSAGVGAALERLAALPLAERARVGAGAARAPGPDFPWPPGLSPADDAALRVSSALAQRDALALLPEPVPALTRRSLARAMHGLVLRHGFRPAELERLAGPWSAIVLGPPSPPVGARRRG
ncbi:MAG TPA: J domain-containing protein [Candidatus Limnocylindrales bacterium]|nr:J domain-containing protein [Candidatus Limnocylindrales bacterium]